MESEFVIERLDRRDVERLKPLWLELRTHHLEVSPSALPAPFGPEVSWERRRSTYLGSLSHPDAFGLIARRDRELVGYALVSVHGGEVLGDTWHAGERVAELETLIVSSNERSQGAGAQLLRRVEDEVRARGIEEMIIGAVATNHEALAFYEHRGYVPYMTYLYARLG